MSALVFGLKQFRQYLLGHHYIARTDHGALTFFNKTLELSGQLARYIEFVSQFDFELQYRAGKSHLNADGISRLPPCQIGPDNTPCRQCNKRMLGQHSSVENPIRSTTVETHLESAPEHVAVISLIDKQIERAPDVITTAVNESGGGDVPPVSEMLLRMSARHALSGGQHGTGTTPTTVRLLLRQMMSNRPRLRNLRTPANARPGP